MDKSGEAAVKDDGEGSRITGVSHAGEEEEEGGHCAASSCLVVQAELDQLKTRVSALERKEGTGNRGTTAPLPASAQVLLLTEENRDLKAKMVSMAEEIEKLKAELRQTQDAPKPEAMAPTPDPKPPAVVIPEASSSFDELCDKLQEKLNLFKPCGEGLPGIMAQKWKLSLEERTGVVFFHDYVNDKLRKIIGHVGAEHLYGAHGQKEDPDVAGHFYGFAKPGESLKLLRYVNMSNEHLRKEQLWIPRGFMAVDLACLTATQVRQMEELRGEEGVPTLEEDQCGNQFPDGTCTPCL